MGYVLLRKKNKVLTITLNDPNRNNPLSVPMCKELVDTLRKAEKDSSIRAVIITGAGNSFSAGADIKEFKGKLNQSAVDVYEEGKEGTGELFKLGLNYTKPIIGAVNGYALGGGFGLVCLCHMAIASDRAKFGLTEINIGLFPLVVLPHVRRVLGERKALELSLTANIFGPEEAKNIGLVNSICSHDEVLMEANKIAQSITEKSPVAVKMGLTAYNETRLMESVRAIDYLNTLRVVNFKSKDLNEGASAFLEKRKPNWMGE
ncbi:enoyl-CoA hydratase/isomerase family protein [Salirhabdus salicampi]|uniref:enoyl-CoA hydratase/isomerase family protein n=1 Tax=Salirhabdus salicampi TaxID=476102 RepID=UPI0020C2179D|nr:enoyl-CoA hydratase/isomerase family protein [Salirhabdus salicampi]MCP8615663.1 enoyl-CoA hydratase/isomerase family protein [Salirhabdus salicampi]